MRLIDADALMTFANNSTIGIDANDIARFPRADAVPVVHGEWIVLTECSNTGWYCSACKKKIHDGHNKPKQKNLNYCPNCGAKMDGGADNG